MIFFKRHIFFVLVILLILISWNLSKKKVNLTDNIPKIENGVLDLRQLDFKKPFNFFIEGETKFYWQEFISYPETKDNFPPPEYVPIAINDSWVGKSELPNHSRFGYGTYSFQILLPDNFNEKISFIFYPRSYLAYEVEINQVVLAKNGVVGKDRNTSKSFYSKKVFSYAPPPDNSLQQEFNNTLNCLIRVSEYNFFPYNQGFEIELLSNFSLQQELFSSYSIQQNLHDGILMGFLVSSFFFFIIFFFFRRGRKDNDYSLWGALLSLVSIVRLSIVNDRVITNWLGIENSGLIINLEIYSFFLGIFCFFMIFYSIYKDFFNKKVFYFFLITQFFFIVMLLLGSESYGYILFPYRIFLFILFIFLFYFGWVAIIKTHYLRYYAFFYFLIFLFLLVVHDVLIRLNVIRNSYDLAHYANFIFVFYQLIITLLNYKNILDYLDKLFTIFKKFVPLQFIKIINNDKISDIPLGKNKKLFCATIFISLKINYLTKAMPTTSVRIKDLNKVLTLIFNHTDEFGGFVDKIIGESIMMAYVNESNNKLSPLIFGIKKIFNLISQLNKVNKRYKVNLNVGIDAGENIITTVGARARMDSTVIGDNVNTSARLQQLAISFKTPFLISSLVKDNSQLVEDDYVYCGIFYLKGKEKPTKVYQVNFLPPTPKKRKRDKLFLQGLKLYEQGKKNQAKEYFLKIIYKLKLKDEMTVFYFNKCN